MAARARPRPSRAIAPGSAEKSEPPGEVADGRRRLQDLPRPGAVAGDGGGQCRETVEHLLAADVGNEGDLQRLTVDVLVEVEDVGLEGRALGVEHRLAV